MTLSLFKLTFANIRFKPLTAVFNILLLAMGIAMMITLGHLDRQLDNRFTKDLKGIDLVVSGKGSPLQIILSNVFHLDTPTGNIPLKDAQKLQENHLVKSTIPLALGDNYNGYRIVGTTQDYITHYHDTLATGRTFNTTMEVVLGSEIAQKHTVKIGDKIVGAHGLANSDDLHSNMPYTVVGFLAPTGTVIDRLVLTPIESVWNVHEHPSDADDEAADPHAREITALLISYKSPLAAAQLQRLVNSSTSMQAASPAFEMARLSKLMGTGGDIISAFGLLLVAFAAFGFFVTLYNAVHERRYDIALMRSLGAAKTRVFGFIVFEVTTLAMAGTMLGVLLAYIFGAVITTWIASAKHLILEPVTMGRIDFYIILSALAISLAAGLIPAIKAYRMNIVSTLVQA